MRFDIPVLLRPVSRHQKYFMRIVALGIEGKYEDPDACLSSVIQTYKNFTAGWRWAGHEKIDDRVQLPTSNVSL